MKFYLVLFLLFASLVLNLFLLLDPTKPKGVVIASGNSADCIERLHKYESKEAVQFPEIFKNHYAYIFSSSEVPDHNFYLGSCFRDSWIDGVTVQNFEESIRFTKFRGYKDYYFYKPAESSTFTIYGQSE